jgi:hypothetical protein
MRKRESREKLLKARYGENINRIHTTCVQLVHTVLHKHVKQSSLLTVYMAPCRIECTDIVDSRFKPNWTSLGRS